MPRSEDDTILDSEENNAFADSNPLTPNFEEEDIEISTQQLEEKDIFTQFFDEIKGLLSGPNISEFSPFLKIINKSFPATEKGINRHLLKTNHRDCSKSLLHYLARVKFDNSVKEFVLALINKAAEKEMTNPLVQEMVGNTWKMTPLEYAILKINMDYAFFLAEELIKLNKSNVIAGIHQIKDRNFLGEIPAQERNGYLQRLHRLTYNIAVRLIEVLKREKNSAPQSTIDFLVFMLNGDSVNCRYTVENQDWHLLHEIIILAIENPQASLMILEKVDEKKLKEIDELRNKHGDSVLLVAFYFLKNQRATREVFPVLLKKIINAGILLFDDREVLQVDDRNRCFLHSLFRNPSADTSVIFDKLIEQVPPDYIRKLVLWKDKDGDTPLAALLKEATRVTPSKRNTNYASKISTVEKLVRFCVDQKACEEIGRLPLDGKENTLLMLILQNKSFHQLLPVVLPISNTDQTRADGETALDIARREKVSLEDVRRKAEENPDPPVFYMAMSEHKREIEQQLDLKKIEFERDLNRVRKERDEHAKDLKRIRDERDGYKKDVKRIRSERDKLKTDTQKIGIERDGYKTKADTLEKHLKNSQAAEKKAKEDQLAARGLLEIERQQHSTEVVKKLEEQKSTHKKELQGERDEAKGLLVSLQETKDAEIAKQKDEIDDLRKKLAESEAKKEELIRVQMELELLKQSEQKLRGEIEGLEEKKKELERDLKETKESEENLRGTVSNQQKDIDKLSKDKKLLEMKVKQLEEEKRKLSERPKSPLGKSASDPTPFWQGKRPHPGGNCSSGKKKLRNNSERYGLDKKLEELLKKPEVRKEFNCEIMPYDLDYGDIQIAKFQFASSSSSSTCSSSSSAGFKRRKKKPQKTELNDETKYAIGHWGESVVFRSLQEQYKKRYHKEEFRELAENFTIDPTAQGFKIEGYSAKKQCNITVIVTWCNKEEESEQSIDLMVEKNRDLPDADERKAVKKYLEVKATRSSQKNTLSLSERESANMIQYGKYYTIFRVYNAGTEQRKIVKVTNPQEKIFNREIKITSLKLRM